VQGVVQPKSNVTANYPHALPANDRVRGAAAQAPMTNLPEAKKEVTSQRSKRLLKDYRNESKRLAPTLQLDNRDKAPSLRNGQSNQEKSAVFAGRKRRTLMNWSVTLDF